MGYAGRVNHLSRARHQAVHQFRIEQIAVNDAVVFEKTEMCIRDRFEAVKDAIKDPVRQKRAKHAVY